MKSEKEREKRKGRLSDCYSQDVHRRGLDSVRSWTSGIAAGSAPSLALPVQQANVKSQEQ
jgi:hypothetical protein